MNYEDFIRTKKRAEVATGHNPGDLNEYLFDFQHAIVAWAVRRGRAAIFADTGLGKTLMQLAWADEVASHTSGIVLVLAPLAVSEQTIEQGRTFGIEVNRVPNGCAPSHPGVWITNYERMDAAFECELSGIVLDESSILKAHDGKTRSKIIALSQVVNYNLVGEEVLQKRFERNYERVCADLANGLELSPVPQPLPAPQDVPHDFTSDECRRKREEALAALDALMVRVAASSNLACRRFA